jgi:hypothetical protein
MPNWKKVIVSGSSAALTTVTATAGFTGSLSGSATSATSASYALTASFVNTLNQSVIVTASMVIGSSSLGPNENTLTLGARDSANEGGQLGLNAPGGTYTSASFLDIWQNQIRILRGSNAGSDGLVTQWNLHTKQMQLPAYTNASSFVGTAAANLAVDSGGNVITVSTTGGSVFPYVGNAVITGSLTTTGIIYAQPNGGMYFQGGDDAALYDINVVNTMGVYGVQDSTVGSIKLGSGGGTISGKSGNIGIGTINPTSASLTVSGNVWATSFTGSLQGTASYATQALSASWAPSTGVTINNNTNNYLITATGTANTLNGEATLQFDGSTLAVDYAKITLKEVVNDFTQSIQLKTDDGYLSIGQADPQKAAFQVSDFGTNPKVKIGVGNVLDVWMSGYNFGVSGSTTFKGDVGITGSFYASSSNGALTETKAFDANGVTSINFASRGLFDSTAASSINWDSKYLYLGGITVVDWGNLALKDAIGTSALDWNARYGYDSLGNSSLNWGSRNLFDSSNNVIFDWDSSTLNYKIEAYTYFKKLIDTNTQERFSDVPSIGLNYEGEVIGGTLDAGVNISDLIYLETDGVWYQNSQGTADCSKLLGICTNNLPGREEILLEGSITVNDSSLTNSPYVQLVDHGLPIYIRGGSGIKMSTVVPSTSGEYVRVLGHAYYQNTATSTYWTMKFRPSNDWYVI